MLQDSSSVYIDLEILGRVNTKVRSRQQKQEANENDIQLIVSCSYTTKSFDSTEKALDLVPSFVKLYVIRPGFLRVALGRNDRLQPTFFRKTTCRRSTIGLIHQQFAPGSQQLPQPLYQLAAFRTIMGIAGREMKNQRTVGTRGNQMNLGGPSSPGLSDRLRPPFFKAPVPSGWTLTQELSRHTASSLMRRRRSCCRRSKTLSKTPDFYHRLMRI